MKQRKDISRVIMHKSGKHWISRIIRKSFLPVGHSSQSTSISLKRALSPKLATSSAVLMALLLAAPMAYAEEVDYQSTNYTMESDTTRTEDNHTELPENFPSIEENAVPIPESNPTSTKEQQDNVVELAVEIEPATYSSPQSPLEPILISEEETKLEQENEDVVIITEIDKRSSGDNRLIYEERLANFEAVLTDYQVQFKDSDSDGIIDIFDRQPDSYDVTDRDLRFFQELAYRSAEELHQLFNEQNSDTIEWFNKEKLKNAADIREIINIWQFAEQFTFDDTTGFSVSLFKQKENLVAAFRGTNNGTDIWADIDIMFGNRPGQVKHLQALSNYISANYQESPKLYLTGHSLGGYLAAYTAADPALFFNQDYKGLTLQHSAIFNAPGVQSNLFTSAAHKQVAKNNDFNTSHSSPIIIGADTRQATYTYRFQPYGIHGDIVPGIDQYENTRWNHQVNRGGKHSSTNFFGTKEDVHFRHWFSTGYRLDTPYLNLDSDGDGILDVDELKMNTSYDKMDSDNDGWGDKVELIAATDPTEHDVRPLLKDFYDVSVTDLVIPADTDVTSEYIENILPSRIQYTISPTFADVGNQIPAYYAYGRPHYQVLDVKNTWVSDHKTDTWETQRLDVPIKVFWGDGGESETSFTLVKHLMKNLDNRTDIITKDHQVFSKVEHWAAYNGPQEDADRNIHVESVLVNPETLETKWTVTFYPESQIVNGKRSFSQASARAGIALTKDIQLLDFRLTTLGKEGQAVYTSTSKDFSSLEKVLQGEKRGQLQKGLQRFSIGKTEAEVNQYIFRDDHDTSPRAGWVGAKDTAYQRGKVGLFTQDVYWKNSVNNSSSGIYERSLFDKSLSLVTSLSGQTSYKLEFTTVKNPDITIDHSSPFSGVLLATGSWQNARYMYNAKLLGYDYQEDKTKDYLNYLNNTIDTSTNTTLSNISSTTYKEKLGQLSPVSWMKDFLNDDKKLYDVSLPGTHDSAAYKMNGLSIFTQPWAKTQDLTITQQLDAGIRYLDLRIYDDLSMHHGISWVGENLEYHLKEIISFLNANPSEFVVVRLKKEQKDSDKDKLYFNLYTLFSKLSVDSYLAKKLTSDTKIADLRGKIVLLDDTHTQIGDSRSLKWDEIFKQDDFRPLDFEDKLSSVLYGIGQRDFKQLFVNHLSYTSGIRRIRPLAEKMNHYFYQILHQDLENDSLEVKNLGITVMDFPTKQLIEQIIIRNI